ncbi:MAG: hypothetical protein AB7U31_07990 [Synergistaceae bacterium]
MVTYYLLQVEDFGLFNEYSILEHKDCFEIVRDTYEDLDGQTRLIKTKKLGKAVNIAEAVKKIEGDHKKVNKHARKASKEVRRLRELL